MMGFFFAAVLANHLVALLYWRGFTATEVAVNAAMIKADGSADTLHNEFHQQRTVIRFWAWLRCLAIGQVVLALAILAVWFQWVGSAYLVPLWPRLASIAALGLLLGGYFLRTFSPMLNHAMQLPEKSRFYVSASRTTALLDRMVYSLARKLYGADSPALKDKANSLFQLLLNIALVLTLVGYVLLLLPLWRVVAG